jgi:hypothetical protein
MNVWVIRPQLRNQGTESVKWGDALRVILRVKFGEHGSNIWMNLLPDYQFGEHGSNIWMDILPDYQFGEHGSNIWMDLLPDYQFGEHGPNIWMNLLSDLSVLQKTTCFAINYRSRYDLQHSFKTVVRMVRHLALFYLCLSFWAGSVFEQWGVQTTSFDLYSGYSEVSAWFY